jgi:hypothetical protein
VSAGEQLEDVVRVLPSVEAARRLQQLLRSVNGEIARRSAGGATAAFVCECLDRGCVEAVEAPLAAFTVVAATGTYFLVRPEHLDQLSDRIVREHRNYAVVERTL